MRPHRLVMKAFGPFAKETTVDFDAMGNNIYLISGETGSGKTTIFDGIMYALYGTASGGARSSLGTENFHSEYARDGKHRDEMKVELTFSNAGRTYTVVRTMNWGKSGESKKAEKQSVLSENGNTIVWGKGRESQDEVTAKVREILGLDEDQFRRIIMLAQGEFQRFLTANSAQRGDILGKLYDNRKHEDFQLRLKAAAALLKEQDSIALRDAGLHLNKLVIPDEIEEVDREALQVEHPHLLFALEDLITGIRQELSGRKADLDEQEKQQKSLESEKSKAEENNRLFDSLKAKQSEQKVLLEQQAETDRLRDRVKLAEAAQRIIPFENAMLRAINQLNKIESDIRKLEELQEKLESKIALLKEQSDTAEKRNRSEIAKLQERLISLRKILPFYDELKQSIANCERASKEAGAAGTAAESMKELLERKQKRQEELTKLLKTLETAGELAVKAAERARTDKENLKEGLIWIRDSIEKAEELEVDRAALADALKTAQNAELEAMNEHAALNSAFLRGQAGILARDMRIKLETEPQVKCPVCGSVHTGEDASAFAPWHEDMPTREKVDEAFGIYETSRKAARSAEQSYHNANNDIEIRRQSILEKSAELLGVSIWDVLVSGDGLATEISSCEETIANLNAVYEQACEDKQKKENALEEKEALDREILQLGSDLIDANQRRSEAEMKASVAQNSVSELKKQLGGYPETGKEARELIDLAGEQIGKLEQEIQETKTEYDECVKKQQKNNGLLNALHLQKLESEADKSNTEKQFTDNLRLRSFADLETYHEAMSPDGEPLDDQELEIWIHEKNEQIGLFDKTCSDLAAAIRELECATKDLRETDISELTALIDEASIRLKAVRETVKRLEDAERDDAKIFLALKEIDEKRIRGRRVEEKLLPMVSTADGKYAFSRYVLSGFFHRIVEQANIHLDTMTDGEYCLVPKETGDGRSNQGLDLKVKNTITGYERDMGALSGGQTFEASLALALGLSEVVQMNSASNIQIDSMFIDEGFGTLDGVRLDKSLDVLNHLSAGKRQIGIISHVARLDECLTRKVRVTVGEKGSAVRIETDV